MFQSDKFNPDAPDVAPLENEADWELLSLYLDGEATSEEAALVEARLRQDATLAQDFAFLRATTTRLQSVTEVEPPAQLRQAILAQTTQRQTLWTRLAASLQATRQTLAFGGRGLALTGGTLAAALLIIGVVAQRKQASLDSLSSETRVAVNPPNSLSPNNGRKNPRRDEGKRVVRNEVPKPRSHPMPSVFVAVNKLKPAHKETGYPADAVIVAKANIPKKRSGLGTEQELVKRELPKLIAANYKPAPRKQMPRPGVSPQIPSHLDKPDVLVASADYSPQPMMDKLYQRATVRQAMHTDDSVPGQNVDSSDDSAEAVRVAEATVTSAGEETPPSGGVIVRRAHLNLTSLPSIPTNGDIKRLADAHNLGYNRVTLAGFQRQQATVAVFGSRF